MLLDRAHARRRWENQPAVDVTLADLDHEDILSTREAAIQQRRISAGTSTDVGDILDNRQEHLHAFAAVREATAWLDRTLPLAARFPEGEIFREDRLRRRSLFTANGSAWRRHPRHPHRLHHRGAAIGQSKTRSSWASPSPRRSGDPPDLSRSMTCSTR
jgi:hypothetical protein